MMLTLLVVDDDIDKASEIARALHERGVRSVEVRHVSNAREARLLMRSTRYDLVLVDVRLPGQLGVAAGVSGGFEFFDLVMLDEAVRTPGDMVFVTGRDELLEAASREASKRGVPICFFRQGATGWIDFLEGRLKFLKRQAGHRRPSADIAIVTALRDPEFSAVMRLPYGWRPRRLSGDPSTYHFGAVKLSSGDELSVLAVHAPRKGMPSSAALCAKVATSFNPKIIVMLGICAGITGRCNIGDVIIADPAWDWGSGKHAADKEGSIVFRAAPYQSSVSAKLGAILTDTASDAGVLSSIRAGWTRETAGSAISVIMGPMASGAAVLAHSDVLKIIEGEHREVVAVDMEAFGVMAAAEATGVLGLVIKGVCDFGDSAKNDKWQEYAAYSSAAFFGNALESIAKEIFFGAMATP